MSLPDNLAERIDNTRITYPNAASEPAITGSPFVVRFASAVDPQSVCETVTTVTEPWRLFGIPSPLCDDCDFWKVVGTLFHVDDGIITDTSKITFEVSPDWMRVYVKEEADEHRVATFITTLADAYPIEDVSFSGTPPDQ